MSAPPRVLLKTLGCRLNEAELESWAEGFRRLGYELAADGEPDADLVVVNTCAVTAEAARKSRQTLRRARAGHPRARLVASGCLVGLDGSQLGAAVRAGHSQGTDADLIVPNRDKDRLVEIALSTLDLPRASTPPGPDRAASLLARGRQRAFVKVQDGCGHACTFCVATRARGQERSRPLAEIVAQIARLAESGIREAVLTGVHLGGYGSDLGTGLTALVRAVLAETDIPRLRLGSLEPWDLDRGFLGLFDSPRLMPHLHLPVQSGSDAVLRRMGRRLKAADFVALAERGRALVPGLNLGTDIVVGFPGETEADWALTLSLLERAGPGQVHGFIWSPRPGTPAAALPGRVPAPECRRRLGELHDLAGRLRHATLAAQVGETVPVLRESTASRPDELFGYTPSYLPVHFAWDGHAPAVGEIVPVRLEGLAENGERLRGRVA